MTCLIPMLSKEVAFTVELIPKATQLRQSVNLKSLQKFSITKISSLPRNFNSVFLTQRCACHSFDFLLQGHVSDLPKVVIPTIQISF